VNSRKKGENAKRGGGNLGKKLGGATGLKGKQPIRSAMNANHVGAVKVWGGKVGKNGEYQKKCRSGCTRGRKENVEKVKKRKASGRSPGRGDEGKIGREQMCENTEKGIWREGKVIQQMRREQRKKKGGGLG